MNLAGKVAVFYMAAASIMPMQARAGDYIRSICSEYGPVFSDNGIVSSGRFIQNGRYCVQYTTQWIGKNHPDKISFRVYLPDEGKRTEGFQLTKMPDERTIKTRVGIDPSFETGNIRSIDGKKYEINDVDAMVEKVVYSSIMMQVENARLENAVEIRRKGI